MDIEIESTMNDEISTDDEATVFSGEIPSPTSRYFKYDSDIIEGVAEKIIERFILPKLLEEIPVLSVDRITNVSDFNSDSSGYGSALTSPSFENSLLSMNSPVNSEGFCENDENQLQENSLLIEIGNTRNLPSFQNCPSTSSVGQLVQTSREQFSNEQAVMNVLMPELGNTGNSSSFQNLPSTSSVGQLVQTSREQFSNEQAVMNASMEELGNTSNSSSFQNLSSTSSVGQFIQTSQGQFFNKQTMINVSMPVHENTSKSSLQNLLSTPLVEKFTQNSQEQISNEQAMINDLISEKLAYYIPASTVDLSSENTIQNATSPLLDIPSNTLDHSYSIPYSSIGGNSAGDDQSVACNSTPPYNKFDNTQSSFLNQAQLVDFDPNSDLNSSLVHHFPRPSEGCLGMSPGTEEINPILENSMAVEQHVLSNSSPPFAAEFGNFHSSSFIDVPSVASSDNSGTSTLEQSPASFPGQYSDTPCNINEDDELILGVLKKKDVFQKYFSLTDIPTQKNDRRYPSVADFSSVGFEILEEMETSDSESDLLGNIEQNMDCSTEFVPDPSRLENGSMYYQMFGIPNTDCLNDDMQE